MGQLSYQAISLPGATHEVCFRKIDVAERWVIQTDRPELSLYAEQKWIVAKPLSYESWIIFWRTSSYATEEIHLVLKFGQFFHVEDDDCVGVAAGHDGVVNSYDSFFMMMLVEPGADTCSMIIFQREAFGCWWWWWWRHSLMMISISFPSLLHANQAYCQVLTFILLCLLWIPFLLSVQIRFSIWYLHDTHIH